MEEVIQVENVSVHTKNVKVKASFAFRREFLTLFLIR